MKSGSLNLLESSGPHWACYGTLYFYLYRYSYRHRVCSRILFQAVGYAMNIFKWNFGAGSSSHKTNFGNDRGVMARFPAVGSFFLSPKWSRQALRPTQLPIQWVPWTLSLTVKSTDHEADHSPPFYTESKNEWSCTSPPAYAFMVCTGTNLRLWYYADWCYCEQ